MTLDEYQSFVKKQMQSGDAITYGIGLTVFAAKLAAEIRYGAHADREYVGSGLGTVAWFVAANCTLYDFLLTDLTCPPMPRREADDPAHDAAYSLMVDAALFLDDMIPRGAGAADTPMTSAAIESKLALVWWHVIDLGRIFGMSMDAILTENSADVARHVFRSPPQHSQDRSD